MTATSNNITIQQGRVKSPLLGVDGSETPPCPTELISRYKALLRTGITNPYFLTKKEHLQSIIIKLKELQKIQ